MKFCLSRLGLFCILSGSVLHAISLDREAFTFTDYDLNVQVEPRQQRLGVRGKITLRNDSQSPQKIAVLQVSSSLDWRSIKSGDKPLQFLKQPYTSDIDHTGALSEAIVTLPQAVPSKGTIELEIGYEGVIVLDTTRLTRIGTPDAAAASSDWDQISTKFTAVRGAGYVAWYPIATEVANLSESNSLFEVVGRWKSRETESGMEVSFSYPMLPNDAVAPTMLCGGDGLNVVTKEGTAQFPRAKCSYSHIRSTTPSFAIAYYALVERPYIDVYYLPGHDVAATNFTDAAEKLVVFVTAWFGTPREKARVADVLDSNAAPFESGSMLLISLAGTDPKLACLAAAHQLTHAALASPRPWINEGLAHLAQALYVEQQRSRQAALDYMGLHRAAFLDAEKLTAPPRSEDEVNRALVNTSSEELYRSKAMYVWWMLRDMIGDPPLKKALASYRAEQDKDPTYMPDLISSQTQRDLQWFFDDWVYHDRGLPDFNVESAFSRKTPTDSYLVTITVANLGGAGAEVPVTTKFAGGEVTKRLEVRGKNKAVIRVEVPHPPEEIAVNDGSVPESDLTNNVFKIEASASQSLESHSH